MVSEAESNLRLIRSYMEQSKRYSNFAGLSGLFGGIYSIMGAVVLRIFVLGQPAETKKLGFVAVWLAVITLSLVTDYVFTRRREGLLEKAVVLRLGRHMARVALPSLLGGAAITIAFLHQGNQDLLYPYWMLAYGSAIAALGVSAPREVSILGWAFIVFGVATLMAQTFGPIGLAHMQIGLAMFVLTFGLFHVAYGICVARREGW